MQHISLARRRLALAQQELAHHVPIAAVSAIVIEYANSFEAENFKSVFGCGHLPLSLSPDGNKIIGVIDHSIHFWDVESGKPDFGVLQHTKLVCAGLYLPDGRIAACTYDDNLHMIKEINLWDSGKLVYSIDHGLIIKKVVVLSADLLALLDTTAVVIWSLKTGASFTSDWVADDLVLMPDNKLLVVSFMGLQLYDLDTGVCKWDVDRGMTSVVAIDKDRAAIALVFGAIKILHIGQRKVKRFLLGHTDLIVDMVLMEGNRLASGSKDKSVRVWDVQTGQQLAKIDCEHEITSLLALPGGVLLVHSNRMFKLWT